MNKHGGFGDPHSAEPYVYEAQSKVKSLSADSDKVTSSDLNIFTDYCPKLMTKQLHTMITVESYSLSLYLGFLRLAMYPKHAL